MENRLKERLTGAAILVALIVLLVPEMFRGQRSELPDSAGSSGEGPPVRSYTIDLSNGPTRTTPLQSTPPAGAASGADAGPDSGGAASSPAPPALAAPPTPMPATGVAAASAPAAPSTAQPAGSKAASGVPAASNAAASSAATAKASTAAAAAHAATGGWGVQLGLFAQRDNAERLAHTAQAKGFTVYVSDRDPKGLYHVHAAAQADRGAAQALQQRLRDQGFAAAVVAPQPGNPKTPP
jgi:DedD protein